MKSLLAVCTLLSSVTAWRYTSNVQKFDGDLPPGPLSFCGVGDINAGPTQAPIQLRDWSRNNCIISAKATFEARMVLMTQKRYDDHEAVASPVDIAVAWGPLATIWDELNWTSNLRELEYQVNRVAPCPDQVTRSNTANIHVIPRNKEVLERLEAKKPSESFYVIGYLVDVTINGEKWETSLSRTDTGAKSAEILWIEDIR